MEKFGSFQTAIANCLKNDECYGISDRYCKENRSKDYSLCILGDSETTSWAKGCLYEKPGE